MSDEQQFTLNLPIGERNYQFTCPNDAPLGEVYNALVVMTKWCTDKAEEIEKKQKESSEQELAVVSESSEPIAE